MSRETQQLSQQQHPSTLHSVSLQMTARTTLTTPRAFQHQSLGADGGIMQ